MENKVIFKKFILILGCVLIFSSSFSQKLKKLGIEIENATYDFGDVQMWENQAATFVVTNNSKHPISILPLFSENDLEIIYPDQSIHPGETAIIKAIYYTSGTGSFTRKFPLYFNTSPLAYDLKITGNIKSLSPTAYIQCPMAKPEHSKPKGELFGNVAEIESEIPLSGSMVKIVNISSKGNTTFFADKNGNFGSKLPTGNYEVIVEHPQYKTHQSFFFLGQNSGYLKIRLEPIDNANIVALKEEEIKKEKEYISENDLSLNTGKIPSTISQNEPIKVPSNKIPTNFSEPELAQNEIAKQSTNTLNNSSSIDLAQRAEPSNSVSNKPLASTPPKDGIYQAKPPSNQEQFISLPSEKEASPTWNQAQEPAQNTPENPKKEYVIRVIDKKSLDPIADAEIYFGPVLDKKKTQKTKSDYKGMALLDLEKTDYKIVASADSYISGEALIRIEEDNDIIRIYLSPVSDLFTSIYEDKKEEQKPEEFLNQLSFGRTEFTFARDEQNKAPERVSEGNTPQSENGNFASSLPENLPTNNEPLSSEEEVFVAPTPAFERTEIQTANRQDELDSIQLMMANIQNEKEAIEAQLKKAEQELQLKNAALQQQEADLARKEAELEARNLMLEQNKVDLNATKDELENKKQLLEELNTKELSAENPVKTNYELSKTDYAANNVLFLIDISSSMGKENKMDLLKESMKNLALVLRDIDRVAIIAYNQKASIVLESVSGSDKETIINAIDALETSGLTYGVNGLQTAYELLQYYYIGNGNNQIILATDGLFSSVNAPITESELNREVRKQANEQQIRLSVVGFGQDAEGAKLMEKLATNGLGQFIQIKNPWEAKTVLIDEIKLNSKL